MPSKMWDEMSYPSPNVNCCTIEVWEWISYFIAHSVISTLRWRHSEHDSVSNHQPHDCLLNRLFGRKPKKTSKLRETGLCAGNSPATGEFPAQRASNAENVSIWWRHHAHAELSLVDTRHSVDCYFYSFHFISNWPLDHIMIDYHIPWHIPNTW